MKDEEMAEEYATTGYDKKLLTKEQVTVLKCGRYDGFLAGLKAGRPQLHNVADGDLPEEGTEVLNDDGVKVVRINGHWRYVYGEEWEDDAYLDHWCEIPQFNSED